MKNLADSAPEHPFAKLPRPEPEKKAMWTCNRDGCERRPVPDENECIRLWDKYGMLSNIRDHSRMVARICERLASRARDRGMPVRVEECRAAGLLHDLAKTWCLRYGGSHGYLGSSWTIMETGNYAIGQGVLLHVHWPWDLPAGPAICCLPIFVIYADKRVRHDKCVTLEERFSDLLERYGQTREARAGIRATHRQALEMQDALSRALDWNLNEDTFA